MYYGSSVYGVQRKSIARAAEKPLNMHFQPKVVSTPLILIKTLIWYISTEPRIIEMEFKKSVFVVRFPSFTPWLHRFGTINFDEIKPHEKLK